MSQEFLDTYFFDSKLAREVALQKNKVATRNPRVKGLQICYYKGEKLKNAPKNCIHLPLEEIYSYFSKTNNRCLKLICYTNTEFTKDEQISLTQKITEIIALSITVNTELVEKYKKKIKKNRPDFSDKKIRVFIPACRETVVMQHISKNLANTFKDMGYKVCYHTQNSMETCGALANLKAIYKFNPHITININHMNNEYIHKDVFNFVWFQDIMPTLLNDSQIKLRKRDFVFHLTKGIGDKILNKNINSKYQSFCIDTKIYKNRQSIKRKKKIIFIGSSYYESFNALVHNKKTFICQLLWKEFLQKGLLSMKRREAIQSEFEISALDLGHILNYIQRDMSLIYLSDIIINTKIEIYGHGWDSYTTLKPYYKGVLSYGKDISKVYNSATYSLVLGGYVLQQRTLESAASGCIPIVIDSRINKHSENEKYFNESLLFIKKLNDISDLLHKKHDIHLDHIVKANSYKQFVNEIIKTVQGNL